MLIALVVVGALIIGLSPRLAVIGVAAGVLLLDSYDPWILDAWLVRPKSPSVG